MDAADRELESCPAGAGLGLSLHLASLATARHFCGFFKDLQRSGILNVESPVMGRRKTFAIEVA